MSSAAHDFLLLRVKCVRSTSCKKRDVAIAHSVNPLYAQHLQQTMIQSVHDPPIFGYSRFSYRMHERLQYSILSANHIITQSDKSASFASSLA
jgi:hypothetical protein